MTVDPPEGQNAGTAPGQAAGFLFGARLERFDGAMLAGGLFSQLWIGAVAVGAEERSRRDGAPQRGDDLLIAAFFQDNLD